MNYIIIDDEPLAREGMKMHCDQISFLNFLSDFKNPIDAMGEPEVNKADIIFLDIEMPGLTGLDFLRNSSVDAMVILTTAYPQYALEAFDLNVVDYVVKPIRFERLYKAVAKAKEIYDLRNRPLHELEKVEEEFIFIRADRQFVKILLGDIRYIKGMKDYVLIVTDKQKYMTAMNIGTILKKLNPHKFARVAKSYIVASERISSVSHESVWIEKDEIPLGPAYKEHFIQKVVKQHLIDRN